ncbi:MAG: MoaD/ThiS family protein, partial [Candidatus Methanomethylicaceae archaeon]
MEKVTVRFYQDMREAAGVASTEIEIEGPTPLSIFLNMLGERYQKLKPLLANIQTPKAAAIILINGRAPIPISG